MEPLGVDHALRVFYRGQDSIGSLHLRGIFHRQGEGVEGARAGGAELDLLNYGWRGLIGVDKAGPVHQETNQQCECREGDSPQHHFAQLRAVAPIASSLPQVWYWGDTPSFQQTNNTPIEQWVDTAFSCRGSGGLGLWFEGDAAGVAPLRLRSGQDLHRPG